MAARSRRSRDPSTMRSMTLLGLAAPGSDTVYVVGRLEVRIFDQDLTLHDVLPMMRHGNEWRSLLGDNLRNKPAMLEPSTPKRP